jgi:prepilin-type N-terminal cleavage/methylation domain-containing protein
MPNPRERRRSGFTFLEIVVALAVIGVLLVVVFQSVIWSMRARQRLAAQQAAVELAANVLESARAQPWDKLDKSWADAQAIPTDMEALLPDGEIAIRIEQSRLSPDSRQVTVEVRWRFEANVPHQEVQLTTLLGPRQAKLPGGQP